MGLITKYFNFTFYTDTSGHKDDKKLRTWPEVMSFLKDMYFDCDMISIKYVGER